MIPTPLHLMGAPGSPYTRKMLALLRYRRIPYRFSVSGSEELAGRPKARVGLLPTFFLPAEDGGDGEIVAVTDSTPLIRRFEAAFPERSVIPPDPALAFVNELLEDFGDEWLTKAMFHYRWTYPADIEKARNVLVFSQNPSIPDEAAAPFQKAIGERQIERLRVVGSNEITGPVIEESYRRIVTLLDAHLADRPYLMGRRPGSCDFAFFGQLTALVGFDPTPSALTLDLSSRVYAWVGRMEDLSGLEPSEEAWTPINEFPETLKALLLEVGRGYVPVMRANAQAVSKGASEVTATVEGARWIQAPFPYQAKCVGWLRDSYAALPSESKTRVDRLLAGTGCEALVS